MQGTLHRAHSFLQELVVVLIKLLLAAALACPHVSCECMQLPSNHLALRECMHARRMRDSMGLTASCNSW